MAALTILMLLSICNGTVMHYHPSNYIFTIYALFYKGVAPTLLIQNNFSTILLAIYTQIAGVFVFTKGVFVYAKNQNPIGP